MPYSPADRQLIVEAMCAQIAAGRTLKDLCRQPGFPGYTTIHTWRRADVHIADRFSAARVAGATVQALANPTAYDPALFAAICARLDAGEHLYVILRTPGMPSRYILWKWRAQHAHVDQALAARVFRPRGRRPNPPVPPYDERAAEAFLDRVARGERVAEIWNDPTALPRRTWYAWLKTNPELRAGMKGAGGHARRKREFATRKLTPALQAEICRRMCEEGLSLNQIARQPDMPSGATFVLWQRDMPGFRNAIAWARRGLIDRLVDEVGEIAEAVTPATAPVARIRFAAIRKRVADLEARDPDRRR